MAELTECRNTPELHTGGTKFHYRRTAGAKIFAGSLVCQNSEGLAVPAADAANLVVLGRAENCADAGEELVVKRACFLYDNGSEGEALTAADIGKDCYCLDGATVGKIGGTNKVLAGKVLEVNADGVAVEI